MKIVKLEEIMERINNKFPNQPFEIIQYTKVSEQFIIKCLCCGKVSQYSNFNNYINSKRKGLCSCYNENNNETKHKQTISKIEAILNNNENIEFVQFSYDYKNKKNLIKVKCNKCNQIFTKPFGEFIKNENCPYCIGREQLNTVALKQILQPEYSLLSEYINSGTKVLVRHNECGFIWKTYAKKLNKYAGCPKCNHKRSKGERKIETFLVKNGIKYEIEKSFEWQSNLRRRYDFYIEKYNLIIEYNGEQHYRETNFFQKNLNEQQAIDALKEKEAKENGYNYLIIKYTDFNNIENILIDWFNDYPKGVHYK